MNILFLSTRSPYPLISGHSLRTYHTLKGAAERHSVTLLTFVQLDEEMRKENLQHLKTFCQEVFAFRIPVDMSRFRLAGALAANMFWPLPFTASKYDVLGVRHKIRDLLSGERFDLVHVDMLHMSVYYNQFMMLPKVIVNHNVESLRLYRWYEAEKNLAKKLFLFIQWKKLRKFERTALNKFDGCIAVSEVDMNLLKNMGVEKPVWVVPNGTDTKYFAPGSGPSERNTVLWIGHMDVHTNRDAVLYFWREIYPILRQQVNGVKLTFVGTGPPKEIKRAAEKDSSITATGFVDDIRRYVQKATVVIVPLRIGSGTRLKILDCMAMGKAVVSTTIGCEGLNVVSGRDIMVADKPSEFSARVTELLKSESLRLGIETEALRTARAYDWANIVGKQEVVYEALVTESARLENLINDGVRV